MLRKLFLLAALLSLAAILFPVLHQKNPDALNHALSLIVGGEAPESPVSTLRAPTERKAAVLLGRKIRVPSDERGHYTADFRLNGRRVTALLDTGATYVAINRSTARQIGLSLSPSDFRHQVNTANGATAAAVATIDRIDIGRIHVEHVQAVVLDDKALSGTLVGLSFLNRLARFHAEDGALLLEQ